MASEPSSTQSPPSKVLLADAAQPEKVPGRWVLFSAGVLLLALFVSGIALAFGSGSQTTVASTQAPAASKPVQSSAGTPVCVAEAGATGAVQSRRRWFVWGYQQAHCR